MADFNVRSDSVNVEQIMEQIRSRIRDKRGVDYTEEQIRELAAVKLQKFLDLALGISSEPRMHPAVHALHADGLAEPRCRRGEAVRLRGVRHVVQTHVSHRGTAPVTRSHEGDPLRSIRRDQPTIGEPCPAQWCLDINPPPATLSAGGGCGTTPAARPSLAAWSRRR